MPTELVLLSEVEPALDVLVRTAGELHPDGTLIEYRDGQLRQLINAEGHAILTMYRARPVTLTREAETAVAITPTSFSLWTDMTIPFGDPAEGRAFAEAIADAVGGVITDRT